ncbi:hypothetical protein [Nocardia sp. NPDC057668]|uniref:hypothetical protein n=1 Tax=Nocardia sp. NPDC057668 TaxID=3346202 RepID=UPI00366EECAB
MRRNRTTFIVAATALTVAGGVATASAEPAAASDPIGYRVNLETDTVVTVLDRGTFATAADAASITVRDDAGRVRESLPLAVTLDGRRLPLRQEISVDGRTLRLTPDLADLDRTALRPVASPLENQLAMNDLINAVSLGTSIGSLVGTAIGTVAGVGVGIALAGASCLVLSLGCVVTVLPIVSMVAAAGGLAGLILAGGPTAAAAAFGYWSTLRAEPGTSPYAPHVQGAPAVG